MPGPFWSLEVSAKQRICLAPSGAEERFDRQHFQFCSDSCIPPHPILTGAGFVGFHLTQRLARDGFKVVAVDDFNPYYSSRLKRDRASQLKQKYGKMVNVIDQDICDEESLNKLFDKHHFSHAVNLAAQAGVRYSLQQPQAYVRANVQCFTSVLNVMRKHKRVKLVYASSSSVYGANKESPFSEFQRVDTPNSLYAATKKANEAFALVYHNLYNFSCTGLRFFTVYGPWGRPDMAYFSFAHKMTKNMPIQVYGHGKPRRDFTYVDDVVAGIVGAMSLGAPYEVFNLGNNEPVGLMEFIKTLESELGVTAVLNMTDMAPGDVLATHADVDRAGHLLGYKPTTSLRQGLHKFAKWFKSSDYKEEYATDGLWITGQRWDRYPEPGKRRHLAASTTGDDQRPLALHDFPEIVQEEAAKIYGQWLRP